MSPDARRHYRTTPPPTEELRVEIHKSTEPVIPGTIVDLCAAGVRIFIDQKFNPIYGLGEALYLHLTSKHSSEPLVAPGLVRERTEVEGGRNYVFVFIDPMGLLSRVPPELAEAFNQRGDFRVEPDPDAPIDVTVDGTDSPFKVRGIVRDISTAGMSFYAAIEAERRLSKVKVVDVSFQLPDNPEPVSFSARIRHRHLTSDGICYGLIFEIDGLTAGYQKRLSMYVASRQRCWPSVEAERQA